MLIIVILNCLILLINSISINIIEKDLNNSIEKILLLNNNLFIGTINSLHRLSSKTLNKNLNSLIFAPNNNNNKDYHLKIFLVINNKNLFLCGTYYQGLCEIRNENLNLIINSTIPIIPNDSINSSYGLIIPEKNFIYFGVTYTNWKIPNICARSLNINNFMNIITLNNTKNILNNDISLRFMARQQSTFIVDYIYSFSRNNYIYFITNQPIDDINHMNKITKIIRFCQNSLYSIIHSYIEMPLICLNSDWIIKSAEIFIDKNNQMILIGLFKKRYELNGTIICSWNIQKHIDKTFTNNYQNCYTMGIGQRGLNFIKPNEFCRKDENWSIGMNENEDNICPWIINDHLPYPIDGINPSIGNLLYENFYESSTSFHLHLFASSILIFQGLNNGTFKLGIFHFLSNINWIYSYQLSENLPILSDILFDNSTATVFLASGSKISRLSFSDNCTSYLSCDECLSSLNRIFCGWCSIDQRCTSLNDCPLNSWQQDKNQCINIINIQPLNASIDEIQWINLTLSKLPQLEYNEIYQCIFHDKIISTKTQAIKLDYNQISCPTPFNYFKNEYNHIQIGHELKLNISIIKWPLNKTLVEIREYIFYNCSSYLSCESCQLKNSCQWCSNQCLSNCIEDSTIECLKNSSYDYIKIKDFYPKILPLNGETLVKIYLNKLINFNEIIQIKLSDINCLIINISNYIECLSNKSNIIQQGPIKIYFKNSKFIFSNQFIEYRQSSIISINPLKFYEYGGQILNINGKNLIIGNNQKIFIGKFQCIQIESLILNNLTCRLPSLLPGYYNIIFIIDNKTILNNNISLEITPNPIIEYINPLNSFASGGRLITIRGKFFYSSQLIIVQFSYRKWNVKLKINLNEDKFSFNFRTPELPLLSNEFNSLPINVNFSIYFDNLYILKNLIEFHYISDILLNISSNLPILFYTGDEIKLQIENLTDAASIDDIQLFIACNQCQIKTFTSKQITCQPPTKLITKNIPLVINKQQNQADCAYNSSVGPIRFRIGFREYIIGYLSYINSSSSSSSSRFSLITIIYLSLSSCLLITILLIFGICLCFKLKKSKKNPTSLTSIKNLEQNEKTFWSTTTTTASSSTAAITGPYYQVYEQIPSLSSSSHQNTLTRASLLVCPCHHHQYKQQLQTNLPSLTNISIEHDYLKKLIFTSNIKCNSLNERKSMELFYDLLCLTPFCETFIEELILNNCNDLYKYYGYIFRYNSINLKYFPLTREILFIKLISKFFYESKKNLIELFELFDNLINNIIKLIDNKPCDDILNRSMNSISSSTLLLSTINIEYNLINLSINYENNLHFNISVFDCDTINQIEKKLIYYLNLNDNINLFISLKTNCLCQNKIPIIKDYSIDSIIYCQKKIINKKKNFENNNLFLYHLCKENQLIENNYLIYEKLKENKKILENFLFNFYQQIQNGLKISYHLQFNEYIQLISDLIRKLYLLSIFRSTCPIIQSCLNVIADGLEFIFQINNQFSTEIELLFEDERKYFQSFDKNSFKIYEDSPINSLSSSLDIRSLILADDTAIQCLLKLYQFYELHSESINQRIGENHVSVLLPVHHLLLQIRQLINSD